jgi:3-dehydroquinate dehydratase-2
MPKPIYVLNGPNLNLLGTRQPHIYGADSLADIQARCQARATALGFELVFRQSNKEGELVDWLNEAATKASAVVLNAAAYGHTSIAIYDAIKAMQTPVVDCHLSNPVAREAFRHHSYVSMAAVGTVSGFGARSYDLALDAAAALAAAS